MLSSISWNQYFWSCGLLSVIYYMVIGWMYYRYELASLFKQAPQLSADESGEKKPEQNNELSLVQQYSIAEQIKKEIKELFASLPGEQMGTPEIIGISKERLSGLASITEIGLKTAIGNVFSQQVASKYRVQVSEQDIQLLWN